MGNRAGRRQPAGLGAYGTGYDPYSGMDYYGGGYDPYYPTGGYATGYVTTAIIPAAPIVYPGRYGGANALGGGLGLGLPPKIRAIFIPQGGAPMSNPW